MSLQNLQADFAEAVLSDIPYFDAVEPAGNLVIYKNNIFAHQIHALKDIYPLITKLVGDDFFRMTAKEYINRYPSRSGNLHAYGEYFSDFLAEYPPLHDMMYLAEVAQFEWACHTAFFAADHAALDLTILEKLPSASYDHLHFVLHPAARIFKFHYPILHIIDLCKHHTQDHIDVSQGGVNLLIIRRHLDIALVPLSIGECAFLQAIHQHASLTEALNAALAVDDSFKLDEKLPLWIQEKTIVDCYTEA